VSISSNFLYSNLSVGVSVLILEHIVVTGILTGSCNFPAAEVMGAQNFNFNPKFSQNRGFLRHKFCILG